MKSNDKIPADEMLLAEAIAAAKARGLGWITRFAFGSESHRSHTVSGLCGEPVIAVCAVGALHLAGRWDGKTFAPNHLRRVAIGNDSDESERWTNDFADDHGESLGYAFRCAMQDPHV